MYGLRLIKHVLAAKNFLQIIIRRTRISFTVYRVGRPIAYDHKSYIFNFTGGATKAARRMTRRWVIHRAFAKFVHLSVIELSKKRTNLRPAENIDQSLILLKCHSLLPF